MQRDHITIRLSVPADLWRAYKGLCIARGIQVAEPVVLFMKQAIQEWYRQGQGDRHEDRDQKPTT